MIAQPNALAVLDDLIADMGDTPGTTGHQVAQVRDAVAELIEATRAVELEVIPYSTRRPYSSDSYLPSVLLEPLSAALAKFGGA